MQDRINAAVFCSHHHIEVSFLQSLHNEGLIALVKEKADCFLPSEELETVERFVRLHRDLHINLEGLDAVQHLLQRMEHLQSELASLRNQVVFYRQRQDS